MPRHAGFGAVATITGGLIDSVMRAYAEGQGSKFFPAPDSVTIGGVTISFAGIFEMLAPTIELHANPGDLVTLHFGFKSSLRAKNDSTVLPRFRRYDVVLTGSVTAAIITNVVNNQVVLGINTGSVVFSPLAVSQTAGPPLPAAAVAALRSHVLAAAATAFVQSRPNLTISPPAASTVIERVQPGDFPDAGISIFEWFRIRLEASRIVVKPLEGVITIGVDFAGYTSGDPNQLVDLTSTHGGGHVYRNWVTPKIREQGGPPYVSPMGYPPGGSFAALFNMQVLSRIMEVVSSQVSGTRIAKEAKLMQLSANFSTFTKPLYPGQQEALWMGFKAETVPGGVEATGGFYLQPYVTVFDGPTDFLQKPYWSLRVAHSELDIPWYVEMAVLAVSAFIGVMVPALIPILAVGAIAILDGVIPGLLGNVRNRAQQNVSNSLADIGLPSPEGAKPLPGLPGGSWGGTIHHIVVTPEGMDFSINASAALKYETPHIVMFDTFHAEYRHPILASVKLSPQMEALSTNLSVVWEVRRLDDNVLLGTVNQSYKPNPFLSVRSSGFGGTKVVRGVVADPTTNGIMIGLRDPDLYFVEALKIKCTVTATLGNQVGDIWTDERTLLIDENLDRHHKFVQWGPKQVFFNNPGTGGEWWTHNRSSRIHRTATGGRCRMMRQVASKTPRMRPKLRYSDVLPFTWAHLFQNRHYLCEYCFFGGPDKTVPFPEEDWF